MLSSIAKYLISLCLLAVWLPGEAGAATKGPEQTSLPTRMVLVVSAQMEDEQILFQNEGVEAGSWRTQADEASIFWSGDMNGDGLTDYVIYYDNAGGETVYLAFASLFGAQYLASELGSFDRLYAFFETDYPVFCGARMEQAEKHTPASSMGAGAGCYCYGHKYGAFYTTKHTADGEAVREPASGAALCLHRELGDYLANSVHIAE